MAEACEECTQSCIVMHKRNKNPKSLVTTFFKVMMGDDYSKILFLPPKFASSVKERVGETTHLENLNGEKLDVKFTQIDGRLAFGEGWDTFALKHGLQKGDVLVFHYVMKSHFVVLMYGSTGCPEMRHFGFSHHPEKEIKKSNNNLITDGQNSSKVHTNCNNLSHESSSKSEPVHGMKDIKKINKKPNEDKMLPNKNITNTQHLVASSSQLVDKEMDQRSELLVQNTFPDYMFSESPTTVNPFCLVDKDAGHELDECRRNSLQPPVVESDGGQKNKVAAGGCDSGETEINRIQKSVEPGGGQKKNAADSDETGINRIRKVVELDGGQKNVAASNGGPHEIRKLLETRLGKATEKRKERTMIQSEVAHSNSIHKRLRPAKVPISPAKIVRREEVVASPSRLNNSGHPSTSTRISPKPIDKWTESIKKEPPTTRGSVCSLKMEPAGNHGSSGLIKKEPTMNHGSGGLMKREPKPEPVDYDEAPLSGSSNKSFSATMNGYQYLELPGSVKLKSKVILLRNGADLWPVLYQVKYGLKALTTNWSIFAWKKGIKVGDKCDFVLESEPISRFACNVFRVHVTR